MIPFPTVLGRPARAPGGRCRRCGAAGLRPGVVTAVLPRGTGLVAVGGIPARVCPACGEEHLDDAVAGRLDRMRRGDLDLDRMDSVILVPLYRFAAEAGAAA